jgi:hypothetical protein
MGESAPLQLATHGLSGKDLAVLRSLLALYRDRVSCELFLQTGQGRADLHLIDVDDPAGRASWEALRARSRCIVLSREAVEAPLLLNKPLRGPALLAVLSQSALQSAPLGLETTGTMRVPLASHGRLLIDLLESKTIDRPVRIETPDPEDPLWIEPELGQYLASAFLAHLRDFLRTPLSAGGMQPVSREQFRQHAQRVRPQTLMRLRWSSALACSDGYLLAAIDRSMPFRLTAWPDMEGHTPSFFRVAGLLLKRAVTFDSITGLTGVDVATAANFVNASYRCGLIAQESAPRRSVASGFASGFGFGGRDLVAKLRQRLGM